MVGKRSSPYVKQRDQDREGCVLHGLRYVWNLLKHHPVEEVVRIDSSGMSFPITFPMVFHEVVWRPFATLPLPPCKFLDPESADVYQRLMEDGPVRHTFTSGEDFLLRELSARGSPPASGP